MNINRDKHNKYVAGWTPNITTSTGSETSSGSTSTIIYVGGGGSSSGGDSGTVTQQNTFLYYIMSDGTNSITQTATIPTDTATLTLIGKNGVTVTASQEKSIPETEFVSTGTNTGTYKISYNKLVTTPDPTEEAPKPQPVTTYPVTITYVSGDKILTSSFDTLTLYNTVDETEQVVATYNQTQLQIDGDTTGINSIVADANNTVFSRITLSITVEEQTTIVLDFAVTVNQQDILYVEGTQTEQYWKLDDDGNLYTTYNTYSTQELSAYGIGESEGTPTTGAEYLYQLRDVSDAVQTPINKGILQYNAATSQWEVTDGSNITPDLTGYAKEDWVTQQITNQINILKGDAPENMDTLGEIAGVISSLSDRVTSLEVLLEWFEWDDANDAIKALFDLYGVGEITAYGYNTQEQPSGAQYLNDLLDVTISDPTNNQILIYNGSQWVNQVLPESGLNESELAQYLTEHNYVQSSALSQYATITYVDGQVTTINNRITALVGDAPEDLDTLGEIATVIQSLEQLLDWFSFVDGKIRANYDLWGVGEITAYGVGEESPSGGKNYLHELEDVLLGDDLASGQLLQYNGTYWVNIDKDEVGLNETELANYLTQNNYLQEGDITWSNLPGKPSTFNTTINQINDLNSSWDSILKNAPTAYVTRWPNFSEVTDKPTTLAGYGITDAYTKTETDNRYVNITGDTMTGNLILPALIANDYIRIGSTAILEYDRSNNAIRVTTSSGGIVNFYATGEVSAYGYNESSAQEAGFLYELGDVQLVDLADGQLLQYDHSIQKWVNVNKDEVGLNEEELNDYLTENKYVTITQLNSTLQGYVTTSTFNNLKTVVDSNTASITNINGTIVTIQSALSDIESDIIDINNSLTNVENDIDVINSTILDFDNRLTTAEDKINNLLDWFSWDNGKVRVNYTFYGVDEISAYGYNSSEGSTTTFLRELDDVQLTHLSGNQLLMYDASIEKWINIDKDQVGLNETELANYLTQNNYLQEGDITWSNLSGKPDTFNTTINQINDLNSSWDSLLLNPPTDYVTRWPAFSEIADKPTTLAGYGITDAYTISQIDSLLSNVYKKKTDNIVTISKTVSTLTATNNDENAWNRPSNSSFFISNSNNALSIYVGGAMNERAVNIQSGHSSYSYASNVGKLYLNKLGGNVFVGNPSEIAKLNVEGGLYATTYIRIGSAKLTYDSSKNILMLTDTNGDTMNFAASGEVSAYGINNEGEDQSHSYLHELEDVQLSSVPPSENDLLVFSDGYWRNISMNDIIPTWDNISGKPSIFPTNLASINDLYSSWDSILKSAPTAYITRWPTIKEIGTDNRYIRKYIGVITDVNADFNDYLSSGLYSVSLSTIGNTTNFPTNSSYGYGILANLITTNNTGIQWYVPDYNNTMAVRVAWSSSRWNAWHYLITNRNYTNYTVTKTGSGASGTWNISITGNSATATKLQTIRTISITGAVTGSTTFDGSSSVTINAAFNAQSLLTSLKTVDGNGSGLDSDLLDGYEATDFYRKKIANVVSVSKALSNLVAENGSADAWNSPFNSSLFLTNNNNALSFYVGGTQNERTANIQVGHSDATYYADILGTLYLNRLGGNVMIGEPSAIAKLNVDGGIYTDSYIQVGSARLRYDSANNAIYVQKSDGSVCNFYSTGEVSAYGIGSSTTLSGFLNDLEDVTIDNVSTGQALIYNGSQWTNQTIQQGLDEEELQRYLDNRGYIPSDATTNIGTAGKLAYYSGASTIDDYTSTVGSNTKFIYLNAGVPTVSNSTIGSTNSPVYINNGTFTPVSYDLNANLQAGVTGRLAYYSGTNTVGNYSVTAGSTYTPIYLNAGVPSTSSTFRVRALSGVYTGAGGIEYPSYFANYGLAVNMMSIPATYCDVIYVNGYNNAGIDVPYINAIAFQKTANTHGEVYHARGDYNGDSWGTWYKFVDSYNYTSIITKLGTSTIGSINNPIYLNNGVPTAITYNLNGNLNAGTAGKLAYYSTNNSIDDYTSTIGSGIKLWYLSSGVPTNSSSTVGSSTSPVYLSSGTITACTYDLSANVNSGTSSRLAYYSSATAIDDYTSTVGSNTRLWYLSSGTPTVSTSTIGSSSQPVYLSNGTITVTTASFLTTSNYTSTLDSRYVNVSGDTMTGNLTVPNININSTITLSSDATIKDNGGKGIYFSYAGVNDKCFLLDETSIRRGANAASMTLGTSTYRWYNVYSQYGNFSSAVTMSSTLKVNQYIELGSCRLKWDSTNNALYIEKSDGTAASFYATGEVSAYGMGSGGPANVDSITFTPGTGNRNLYLSANGIRIITASSTGWGVGIKVYNNANTTKLGDVCGAYGGQNQFTYSYFGGPYNSPGMTILANKNVGIGTTSPTYKLHVSGTAYATGGFQNGSDIRYKDVIQDIFLSVTDIANAPSFTFTWKNDQTKQVQCGTSAQYWQKILPQVIMSTNNQLSMSYDRAALISVISVAKEVETLEQRVSELERENAMLKQRLSDNNKIRTN